MQKFSKAKLIFIALMCCFGTEALCVSDDSSVEQAMLSQDLQEKYKILDSLLDHAKELLLLKDCRKECLQNAMSDFNKIQEDSAQFADWIKKSKNFVPFYLYRAQALYGLNDKPKALGDLRMIFSAGKYQLYCYQVHDKGEPIDFSKGNAIVSEDEVLDLFEQYLSGAHYVMYYSSLKEKPVNQFLVDINSTTSSTSNTKDKDSLECLECKDDSNYYLAWGAMVGAAIAVPLTAAIIKYCTKPKLDIVPQEQQPPAEQEQAAIVIVAKTGTPQSTLVNTAFKTQLSVTVTDDHDHLIIGKEVMFTAPTSGASGVFTDSHVSTATVTVVSGENGIATAPTFIANNVAGGYTVIAKVADGSGVAAFTLINEEDKSHEEIVLTAVPTGGELSFGGPTSLFPNNEKKTTNRMDPHKDGVDKHKPARFLLLKELGLPFLGISSVIAPESFYIYCPALKPRYGKYLQ